MIQIEFSVQAIKQLFRANIRMNTIQKLHFNKEYYYKYYTRNRDRSCILLLNFSRIVDNFTIIIRCKIHVMGLLEQACRLFAERGGRGSNEDNTLAKLKAL